MADNLITCVFVVAAAFVLSKVIAAAAHLNVKAFIGHRWRFASLAAFWALSGAGAVAVAAGAPIGGSLLLVALTLLFAADRRVR